MADWRRDPSWVRVLLTSIPFFFLTRDPNWGSSCSFTCHEVVLLEGSTTETHFGVPLGPVIRKEKTGVWAGCIPFLFCAVGQSGNFYEPFQEAQVHLRSQAIHTGHLCLWLVQDGYYTFHFFDSFLHFCASLLSLLVTSQASAVLHCCVLVEGQS